MERRTGAAATIRTHPPARLLLLLGVLGLVLTLVGCSGSGASDSAGSQSYASQVEQGEAVDSAADEASGGAGSEPGAWDSEHGPGRERSIIQTGYVYLTSADPVSAAATVIELVEVAGGRVDARSLITAAEDRHPWARLTLRIPAAELSAVLGSMGKAADVVESELTAEDVTGTVVDLEARIGAKELSIERLEELLATATTSADIIAAEESLTQRQTELEQLLSQQAALGDAIAMATVTVEITVPSQVPLAPPPGFAGGLDRGWSSVAAVGSGALVALGFALPWLGVVAVVAALTGLAALVRRARRRRRAGTETPERSIAQ